MLSNKALAAVARSSKLVLPKRGLKLQSARQAGHGAPFNPGPAITWDYAPVPCQPYQATYNYLQNTFNKYLGAAVLFFTFAVGVGLKVDVFKFKAYKNVDSYYNKEPVLIVE